MRFLVKHDFLNNIHMYHIVEIRIRGAAEKRLLFLIIFHSTNSKNHFSNHSAY
jgi:ABC-type microcin C transport system permease subunit YejB